MTPSRLARLMVLWMVGCFAPWILALATPVTPGSQRPTPRHGDVA